jgi:NAD-dependent DNA ligase
MIKYPDIVTSDISVDEKIANIKSIRGIEKKTAERFVKNIPKFLEFIKVAKLEDKLNETMMGLQNQQPIVDESNPLYEKSIIITGFRNKELSEELKSLGVRESSAVSKNTFAVIVKDKDEDTGKIEAAKQKNIPIYTSLEFKDKFNLSFTV